MNGSVETLRCHPPLALMPKSDTEFEMKNFVVRNDHVAVVSGIQNPGGKSFDFLPVLFAVGPRDLEAGITGVCCDQQTGENDEGSHCLLNARSEEKLGKDVKSVVEARKVAGPKAGAFGYFLGRWEL